MEIPTLRYLTLSSLAGELTCLSYLAAFTSRAQKIQKKRKEGRKREVLSIMDMDWNNKVLYSRYECKIGLVERSRIGFASKQAGYQVPVTEKGELMGEDKGDTHIICVRNLVCVTS